MPESFWHLRPSDPGRAHLFDEAVYVRGAMTLQALRAAVGDRAFFTILRGWASSRRGGDGTTADFVALAERMSGHRLDRLFTKWLYTPRRPSPGPRSGTLPPGRRRSTPPCTPGGPGSSCGSPSGSADQPGHRLSQACRRVRQSARRRSRAAGRGEARDRVVGALRGHPPQRRNLTEKRSLPLLTECSQLRCRCTGRHDVAGCTCPDLQQRHQTTWKETGLSGLRISRSWVRAPPAPPRKPVCLAPGASVTRARTTPGRRQGLPGNASHW
jgi:hypothetical protein